jgi:hypothetical protein
LRGFRASSHLSAPLDTLLPRRPLLPQVFCASDSRAHEEMRQACFDYLALGGMYSSEREG